MDATGTLGGITLNQTGKEMETILLLMLFYLAISLSISFVMNLYNENVKLVERTSATGHGLHAAMLFGGKWEQIKKGDAQMRPDFGVAGWLNLVVLFHALWFVSLLYFVFISDGRPSYYTWPITSQLTSLLMLVFSGAVLASTLLKGARSLDLMTVELIAFFIAVVAGYQFGEMFEGYSGMTVIALGAAIRVASILYMALAHRPNVTYLHRIPEGTE
jgi:general L-amino acid transport system permease protein